MLHRIFSYVWYSLAAFMVFFGILFGAARVLLAEIPEYHEALEQRIGAAVGRTVRIERISPVWRGLWPGLSLHGVRVLVPDSGASAWEARRVRIDVHLWRSLREHRLQPGHLLVDGTDIEVIRRADGSMELDGLPLGERLPGFDLGSVGITILRSSLTWNDQSRAHPPQYFSGIRMFLEPWQDGYRLNGRVDLPEPLGDKLRLEGNLRWGEGPLGDIRGQFYFHGAGLDLAEWQAQLELPEERLAMAGQVDVEAWAQIEGGEVHEVQLRLDVEQPRLDPGNGDVPGEVAADRLTLVGGWRDTPGGWLLAISRLVLEAGDDTATVRKLAVEKRVEAGHRARFLVTAVQGDLAMPLRFAAAFPLLADDARLLLRELRPQGRISDLALELTLGDAGPDGGRVSARFAGLGFQARGKVPGVTGLDGTIRGDLERGELYVSGRTTAFLAPGLFRSPLEVDRLQADVGWRRERGALVIESRSLVVETPDLETRGRVRMDIPRSGESPFLDLQVAFRNGVVERTGRYLPAGIMPAGAVQWLDRALVSGRITSGAGSFHGALSDFPFDDAQGVFQVEFNVEDMILDYREQWARIEELSAGVSFHNRGMDIRAVGGKILGAGLEQVSVKIPDLMRADLHVLGEARGPLQDMVRVVQESPLREVYGDALGPVSTTGESRLGLRLMVPLSHAVDDTVDVEGSVFFKGNRVSFDGWDLAVDRAEGTLDFTESGLSARAIRGTLFGEPIVIDVDSYGEGRETGTEIRAHGPLGLAEKVRQFHWPVLSAVVSGRTVWDMRVRVPGGSTGDAGLTLELASGLEGVTVSLPPPFDKAAAETRPFSLRTTLRHGSPGEVMIDYAERLKTRVRLASDPQGVTLEKGVIRVGPGEADVLPDAGLAIVGSLDEFRLADWLPLLGPAAPAGGGSGDPLLSQVRLKLGRVLGDAMMIRDLSLDLRHQAGVWRIGLQGEGAKGRIVWPRAGNLGSVASIDLDYLRVAPRPAVPAGAARSPATTPGQGLSPGDLPTLNLRIGELAYDGHGLGTLTIRSRPVIDGMSIDTLGLHADWLKVDASGSWREVGGRQQSSLDVKGKVSSMGRLLDVFGYAANVRGAETNWTLKATWPGSPMVFALAAVEGGITLDIGKGQLAEVAPGAGRLFGLLSVYALPRRLALDFRDVFGKGLAFDSISASFALAGGNAHTDDMVLDGPSARIEIAGRVGLAARDYDQQVKVIPRVTSTLPLAGALAGGPTVGAALLLADKIFGEQIAGLTQYQYTLKGSWDAPEFERVERKPAKIKVPFDEP